MYFYLIIILYYIFNQSTYIMCLHARFKDVDICIMSRSLSRPRI